MSAAKTGTPAAEICSAINCSVLVLPVPVAPATSPCRFSMLNGMRTTGCWHRRVVLHQDAELDGWLVEGVALDDLVAPPRRACVGSRARVMAKS